MLEAGSPAWVHERMPGLKRHTSIACSLIEANWWRSEWREAVAFNQHVEGLERSTDSYKLKVGAQAELGSGWTGWMHFGYRAGNGDFNEFAGLVGMKYRW